jgi:hypothetical protein
MPHELTPYDTGERLAPIPWVQGSNSGRGPEDYGKVDLDDDESATCLTIYVERDPQQPGGYVLHVENVSVPLRVEVETYA